MSWLGPPTGLTHGGPGSEDWERQQGATGASHGRERQGPETLEAGHGLQGDIRWSGAVVTRQTRPHLGPPSLSGPLCLFLAKSPANADPAWRPGTMFAEADCRRRPYPHPLLLVHPETTVAFPKSCSTLASGPMSGPEAQLRQPQWMNSYARAIVKLPRITKHSKDVLLDTPPHTTGTAGALTGSYHRSSVGASRGIAIRGTMRGSSYTDTGTDIGAGAYRFHITFLSLRHRYSIHTILKTPRGSTQVVTTQEPRDCLRPRAPPLRRRGGIPGPHFGPDARVDENIITRTHMGPSCQSTPFGHVQRLQTVRGHVRAWGLTRLTDGWRQ